MLTSRKKFLQQAGLAMAGTCLSSNLFAKEFLKNKLVKDTYHPVDCSIDLATSYQYTYNVDESLSDIIVRTGYYCYDDGVHPNTNPYDNDVMYAAENSTTETDAVCNIPGDDCDNVDIEDKNPFRYKAFFPKATKHDYVARPLPVYIFFHAGGFQECSNLELKLITNLCIELSRKGWVCFSVEYRRGRKEDIIDTTKFSVQAQFARYRAIQDGCGAIRSIIKKNREGSFPFKFNEDQVFVGGTSAGGIIALGCAYYKTSSDLVSTQQIDQVHVKANGPTYNIKQTLGKMHSDRYYAPAESQYWPVIRGVASLWGGFVIPKSYDGDPNEEDCASVEASFFQLADSNANPPLIAFHGALDTVIPFYDDPTQDINLSSNTGFQREDFCTNNNNEFIQKVLPANQIELKILSSLNLYLVMRQLNRFTEFYLDCSMAHGLDDECGCFEDLTKKKKKGTTDTCIPCTYTSDFGSYATNQAETAKYMAERIAVFTFDIMRSFIKGTTLTFGDRGRSYFKDCENFRKCITDDDGYDPDDYNNNVCAGAGVNLLCNGNPLCPTF